MTSKKILYQGIKYDDELLIPRYSKILPREIKLTSRLTKNIILNIPIVAAGVIKQTGVMLSAMGYSACVSIAEMQKNVAFNQITDARLRESHPYDVNITKESPYCFV